MTIKNSSLGDRLNDFKNKQTSSNPDNPDNPNNYLGNIINTFNSILILVVLFIKSFVFGYSLKLIFNTDWNFFGFLCIGLSINFLLQFIHNLIHTDNTEYV